MRPDAARGLTAQEVLKILSPYSLVRALHDKFLERLAKECGRFMNQQGFGMLHAAM